MSRLASHALETEIIDSGTGAVPAINRPPDCPRCQNTSIFVNYQDGKRVLVCSACGKDMRDQVGDRFGPLADAVQCEKDRKGRLAAQLTAANGERQAGRR